MSNDEMRIEIALIMGYTGCVDTNCDWRKVEHLHKDGKVFFPEPFTTSQYPNYPEDLNACHEMESSLDDKSYQYTFELIKVLRWSAKREPTFKLIHATAQQRCIAFLKTVGRWKESKL